jgi:hypothetical protein
LASELSFKEATATGTATITYPGTGATAAQIADCGAALGAAYLRAEAATADVYLRPDGSTKVVIGSFVYIEDDKGPPAKPDRVTWFELPGPLVGSGDMTLPIFDGGGPMAEERARAAIEDLMAHAGSATGQDYRKA